MTIESSLRIEIGEEQYILSVTMIRIESASYFFIKDKQQERPLLGGTVLELTYTDSFSLTEFSGIIKSPGIPAEITLAIQNAILKNQRIWLQADRQNSIYLHNPFCYIGYLLKAGHSSIKLSIFIFLNNHVGLFFQSVS